MEPSPNAPLVQGGAPRTSPTVTLTQDDIREARRRLAACAKLAREADANRVPRRTAIRGMRTHCERVLAILTAAEVDQ